MRPANKTIITRDDGVRGSSPRVGLVGVAKSLEMGKFEADVSRREHNHFAVCECWGPIPAPPPLVLFCRQSPRTVSGEIVGDHPARCSVAHGWHTKWISMTARAAALGAPRRPRRERP
jgi:hypothetical protein